MLSIAAIVLCVAVVHSQPTFQVTTNNGPALNTVFAAGSSIIVVVNATQPIFQDVVDFGLTFEFCQGGSSYISCLITPSNDPTNLPNPADSTCYGMVDSTRVGGSRTTSQMCLPGSLKILTGFGGFALEGSIVTCNVTADATSPAELQLTIITGTANSIAIPSGWSTGSSSLSCIDPSITGTISRPTNQDGDDCDDDHPCQYRAYYLTPAQAALGFLVKTMCGIRNAGVLMGSATAPTGASHPISFELPTSLPSGNYVVAITVSTNNSMSDESYLRSITCDHEFVPPPPVSSSSSSSTADGSSSSDAISHYGRGSLVLALIAGLVLRKF